MMNSTIRRRDRRPEGLPRGHSAVIAIGMVEEKTANPDDIERQPIAAELSDRVGKLAADPLRLKAADENVGRW